jgi:hypothetical protein
MIVLCPQVSLVRHSRVNGLRLSGSIRGSVPAVVREEHVRRQADFSLPIHFVCPAPTSFTATFSEVLVCRRDHFAVDPARRGFAADGTSANPLPFLNSSRWTCRVDLPATVAQDWRQRRFPPMVGRIIGHYRILEKLGVLGLVHHAHPAATQLLEDSIMGNGFADHDAPLHGAHRCRH